MFVYSKTYVFFKLNYLHFQVLETWANYYCAFSLWSTVTLLLLGRFKK